jgi:hypothetical protein
MRMIMEILRHSTIILTMNTYAHALSQAQREALALMEDSSRAMRVPLPALTRKSGTD